MIRVFRHRRMDSNVVKFTQCNMTVVSSKLAASLAPASASASKERTAIQVIDRMMSLLERRPSDRVGRP